VAIVQTVIEPFSSDYFLVSEASMGMGGC